MTATDRVGNTTVEMIGYQVHYDVSGFSGPLLALPDMSSARAGQSIPVAVAAALVLTVVAGTLGAVQQAGRQTRCAVPLIRERNRAHDLAQSDLSTT